MKAREIADYINLNFAEDVLNNVSSLAEKFNISERSMAWYFKQVLNMPLHEYIIKTRMNKALEKPAASLFLICTYPMINPLLTYY